MAYPSDLVRTKDWGTETLTDADLEGQYDLIIDWVMAAFNSSTGHKHDGTSNEGPTIGTTGLTNDAVTFDKIDDDGNFGPFTGDWSFNEIALVEDTAPSTAASEGKLYTKDTGGQPELFFREESDGDEVQITTGGTVNATIGQVQIGTSATSGSTTNTVGYDNTTPLAAEGVEVTSVAITPANASSTLIVEAQVHCTNSSATNKMFAYITVDAGDGLSTAGKRAESTTMVETIPVVYSVSAGSTSARTYKLYLSSSAGTTYYNRDVGGDKMNGTFISSIKVTEVLP